jgi:Putative Flp pilus-assembly TadE/G-like
MPIQSPCRVPKSFLSDRSGNVSLVFALVAIPVLGCVGLAVDFGRQAQMQTHMQNALDSAVLAGAGASMSHAAGPNEHEGPDMTALIEQRLTAALAGTGAKPFVSVSVNAAEGSITASAETTVNTMFMGLFGREHSVVRASATAVAGAGGPMEVAIAFDTTHSMAGAKLAAAQGAASDLTDLLYRLPGSAAPNPNMKVGLVPFTRYVNVGVANRGASWLTGDADYDVPTENCTDTWPQLAVPVHHQGTQTCYNDGAPYDCSYDYMDANDYNQTPTHTCVPVTDHYVWHGCVGSQSSPDDANVTASAANPVPAWTVGEWVSGECPAQLTRLTNDPVAIKTSINALTEGGETYIAPGLLWSWRLLSPDPLAPFHDGGPITAARKRLILMTDGANTYSANYPLHDGTDVAAANAKTLEVCTNIKAAGIEIYAIAFEVTDPAAQDLLSHCASGPPYYYNAMTTADLASAFHKIGRELVAMRLTK